MRITKAVVIPNFIFLLVYYNKGGKTTAEASEELKMTYAATVEINNSFFDIKWAIRKPINDKSFEIVLTDKGKAIAESAELFLKNIGVELKEDEKNVSDTSKDKVSSSTQTTSTV